VATRDVEAGKNKAQIAIEELKVRGNIDLEKQKQDAAERLDRAKFETTLILKATEASRREDQIRNLKFFLTAGFIRDPDNKIANMIETAYPSSPPPAVERVRTAADISADIFMGSKGAVGLVTIISEDNNGMPREDAGTCFVVSKDGYALTAAHLFSQIGNGRTKQISIALGSNAAPRMPAELVKIDQEADIALVKLSSNIEYAPIGISRERPQVAEPFFVIGFPFPEKVDTVISSGIVSSLNEGGGKIGISLFFSPGLSGSPVFGKNGDVVAMAIGNRRDDLAQTVAIPINFARSMLASIGIQ
jgi:S1-C subfamily serine protease